MKKLFLIILFFLICSPSFAQQYLWRYSTHATDCTSLTTGRATELCYEQDDQTLYKCVPTSGGCDTASEWKSSDGGWISVGANVYTTKNIGIGTSLPTNTIQVVGSTNFGTSTGNVGIGTTGVITLNNAAKYARHIQVPLIAVGSSANLPTPVDVETVGGYQFASSGTQEELHFQWEIPDDWDGGAITVEIDWFPNSGSMTNPDAIKWGLDYRSIAEGELVNQGTAGVKTVTYNTTTAKYKTVHSPFILDDANQPLTAQDHIFGRVYRDTTVGSDFGGTVVATEFEILYTSKGLPTSN